MSSVHQKAQHVLKGVGSFACVCWFSVSELIVGGKIDSCFYHDSLLLYSKKMTSSEFYIKNEFT